MDKINPPPIWTKHRKMLLMAILGLQFALAYGIGTTGVLANTNLAIFPPIAMTVVAPVLLFLAVYSLNRSFRNFILAQDIRTLTVIQLWRVVGLVFLIFHQVNLLPSLFALPAGLGDVTVGIAALFIIRNLTKNPKYVLSVGYRRFHYFGLLDFGVALGTAALSSGAFPGLISNGITSSALDVWPLNIFPSFIVPGFIILQISALLIVRDIRRQQATSSSHTIETKEGTADAWFSQGRRVPYDRKANGFSLSAATPNSPEIVRVFQRLSKDKTASADTTWASFLPGWPDGSYGWSKVDHQLGDASIGPRLFVEYIGHGDSDKPRDHQYDLLSQADLVEATWASHGIRSTFIVAFDYSSIVALELLARQKDRNDKAVRSDTTITGVLLINGGLFAEAHTHPWYTTPALNSPFGGIVTSLAQHSKLVFKELVRPLWSKNFTVTDNEIDQLYEAIRRRNGVHAMAKSAGFVAQHKRLNERLNLERLFVGLRDTVSFHVVGSEQDPFEGKQAKMAQERLGKQGLDVRIIPGGHLATSEQPELLANIIREVVPEVTSG